MIGPKVEDILRTVRELRPKALPSSASKSGSDFAAKTRRWNAHADYAIRLRALERSLIRERQREGIAIGTTNRRLLVRQGMRR